DRLLVVHDDIDLPFGKLRAQYGRGHGGHNGVRSVARMLGGADFWRLKIGVGRPPGRMNPADFVLKRFTSSEQPEIDVTVQFAADLIGEFIASSGEDVRERAGQLSNGGS
ncbi:MAG: peptidyl-tRNA hydrolase, partial [Acidimicrobiia bacterium]|nr:peptidyl-tRNA hydrolase [Acidimicrobiia bacterium]